MKKIAFLMLAAVLLASPALRAQESSGFFNHIEVGAFGQYTRFEATSTNSTGFGARLGFGEGGHVALEAEMGYNFDQVFTEGFTNTGNGSVTVVRSNFHMVDGLFGPKFQTRGRVRLFFVAKGGFVHTGLSNEPGSVSGFVSSVEELREHSIDGALYPGLGVEGFLGPIGLRLEGGDLVYFRNGMHNNPQVTFGPTIRF
jgi:opacity protein-like surface antigen